MFLALACLAPLVFVPPLRLALRGALGALRPQPLVPVRVLQLAMARRGLPLPAVVRLDLRRLRERHVAEEALVARRRRRRSRRRVARRCVGGARRRAALATGAAPLAGCRARERRACRTRRSRRADDLPATAPGALGPLALVALACLFGLLVLRGRDAGASRTSTTAHSTSQMVRWADGQIGEGRVPLDGWFPYLSLGSSFFHHYQSLPHTLTAYAAHVTGASDQTARTSGSCTCCSRCGRSPSTSARACSAGSRWTAAAAAAVSPLIVSAPATATSTAATPGGATASTRSSGRCGCCRSPGGSPGAPSRAGSATRRPLRRSR